MRSLEEAHGIFLHHFNGLKVIIRIRDDSLAILDVACYNPLIWNQLILEQLIPSGVSHVVERTSPSFSTIFGDVDALLVVIFAIDIIFAARLIFECHYPLSVHFIQLKVVEVFAVGESSIRTPAVLGLVTNSLGAKKEDSSTIGWRDLYALEYQFIGICFHLFPIVGLFNPSDSIVRAPPDSPLI